MLTQLTLSPLTRAVDPRSFFADPDSAVFLNEVPDPAVFLMQIWYRIQLVKSFL